MKTWVNSTFVLLTAITLFPLNSFAGLDNPLKSDYIDFSKINLNKYIEARPETIIEKIQSQEDPRVTAYFVFEKKINDLDKKLIMQVFDLNGDGKMDLAKFFTNKTITKAEYDLDRDGKVDDVSEYNPKNGELLKKTISHGATNMWKYWYKGDLRLLEMDRNNDHKPDMWIHYRKDKVVKTEVDSNYNGKTIKPVK
jgi:hypothetical protein